jgi:hypothetical protein
LYSGKEGAGDAQMAREFLKVSLRRWLEYLLATLLGNAIYFWSLVPHLPESLRHRIRHYDWGLALDFAVCVGVFGLIRLGERLHRKPTKEEPEH